MTQPDNTLIERLAQFESSGNLAGALNLLGARPLATDALAAIAIALYRRNLSALAFIIAGQLLENGIESCEMRVLSSHLGLRLGQDQAAMQSLARLAQHLDTGGAPARDAVRRLLDHRLAVDAINACSGGNHSLARSLMQLWSLVVPDTVRRFAPPAADHQTDLARFRAPGDPSRLHRLEMPPEGTPRSARKAVIGIRHLWFPEVPASREHDVGPRFAHAFETYGWHTVRHDLRSFHDTALIVEDYRALAALCREHDADMLVIDDFQPQRANRAAGEIIRALRREMPRLRVIGTYFDPWQPDEWNDIEAGAELLDAIWSLVVTPVWQRPGFAGKTLFLPLPHGGSYPMAPRVQPGFRFGGGMSYSNWDRAFWLTALADTGLLTKTAMSSHRLDDLDALESYRAYMMRQATSTEAAINLARRSNGVHTLTGRTFESIATGNLLVQERSDDIDGFFVAGRHYLRFETVADLHDIAHLIRTEPDIVETIRQEGAAFFRERYADERLVAYLDQFLFHRAAAEREAA
jgi:hypothetical protein